MGRPFLARFAVVSFVGLSALAVACAQSEEPDLLGAMTDKDGTEPEADAGTKKLPPKTQKESPPVMLPVVDAGAPTTPPEPEPEEEEEPEPEDCPQTESYSMAALLASLMGGTSCPNGGSDCSQGECCFVNMFSPAASMCVPE
ncbi:MAG: hypothetical protein KIT84_44115 [Labilithrix sp.]|nr:hypothetical protein [Labilithrix sp.]MCW5818065.1 hypothetical protein [Labilithrix sp.]